MRTPQFLIFRGSTPTLALQLPFSPASTDVVFVTFSQRDLVLLEYARNGTPSPAGAGTLSLSEDEPDTLLLEMTQADTLRLLAGDCRLQVRVKTDEGADTFFPVTGCVGEALKEGVIA